MFPIRKKSPPLPNYLQTTATHNVHSYKKAILVKNTSDNIIFLKKYVHIRYFSFLPYLWYF